MSDNVRLSPQYFHFLLPPNLPGPNQVTNGDFASGNINGWMIAGDGDLYSGDYSIYVCVKSSGNAYTTFSQTVPATNAGGTYIFSITYSLLEFDRGSTVVCSLGGTQFNLPTDNPSSSQTYVNTFTAESASTLLSCTSTIPVSNSPVYANRFYFSDIKVQQCL
ncbi:hypothetical protein SEUCBS139899_008920 [Sporothrix eucalyptigena]|uniref:Ig-like domain-containing protein n=1 Tax=Sporothrix eucalyptigena TaxID=1812306 RepID=A0ABP0CJE8_9PEZI